MEAPSTTLEMPSAAAQAAQAALAAEVEAQAPELDGGCWLTVALLLPNPEDVWSATATCRYVGDGWMVATRSHP